MPRSVQICILGGGGSKGGGFGPDQLNVRCQDLSKSAFWEGHGPNKLNSKFQDLSKSALGWWSRPTQNKVPRSVQICIWGGGVYLVQINSTQSSKICPNLHWFGGPDQLNLKCQDLSKSAFWGWGVGVGVVDLVQTNSTQSAKICPNLHWGWSRPTQNKVPRSVQICIFGGGVYLVQINSTQSSKICPNLHWFGGPDQLNLKCQDLSKSAFWGWGVGVGVVDLVQTNSTQSAKICPNLHWGWSRPTQNKVPRSVQICLLGGGGGFGPDQLNLKCQDLSKSAFWGVVEVRVMDLVLTNST